MEKIPEERLNDAVNVILTLHNKDGGWATYENNRGARWYEMMNPSEVFGDIMIDYSYVECSCACICALKSFSKTHPDHRSAEVINAIQAGAQFIKSIQRKDGSWYGSWGVRNLASFISFNSTKLYAFSCRFVSSTALGLALVTSTQLLVKLLQY